MCTSSSTRHPTSTPIPKEVATQDPIGNFECLWEGVIVTGDCHVNVRGKKVVVQ